MDTPDLSADAHHAALAGLRRINRWSHTAERFLPAIRQLAAELGRNHLKLTDIACGGGDVPLSLAHLASQCGITLDLTLLDRSPTALAHARAAAARLGFPPDRFHAIAGDLLNTPVPASDIVTNSLFLHHLDTPEVIAALRQMAKLARHLLLISDLRRGLPCLTLARAACHLLSRSPIVHHDGPASVRAAWTPDELLTMARDAGLTTATIRRTWPCRMLLEYRPPNRPAPPNDLTTTQSSQSPARLLADNPREEHLIHRFTQIYTDSVAGVLICDNLCESVDTLPVFSVPRRLCSSILEYSQDALTRQSATLEALS